LNAPPDCKNQLFHIDYQGDSLSYFIPFVELTDLNGTEYLYFYDKSKYLLHYDLFLNITEKYFDKNNTIQYLSTIGMVLDQDYTFKYANSEEFGLIYMPNYVYHRGQKNKTNVNRTMLNIVFSIANKFDYPVVDNIIDPELDETERQKQVELLRSIGDNTKKI
jgi:hypothetical protein